MLKFRGQTESGEWVEFWIYDIVDTNEVWTEAWCLSHEGSRVDDIKTSTIQLAVDPRKALSEQEVLTRVQAMGEESLSPDNFESLMRALEELKTTRNVDGDSEDPGAELAALRERVKVLREALGKIAILSDEAVTLRIADEALDQTKPKDGE